ncbi:integrin alpha-M-like [Scleropages formosus]|uniref:integrin alpha-M-like n=1 Tax=Scleropages formosus TaxID=113540 RepID=UPI0010FA650E|nr:integrin alpha-M-like [Scleropages formosus]
MKNKRGHMKVTVKPLAKRDVKSQLEAMCKATECFNLDPAPWKSFPSDASSFGYQVIQVDTKRLLVSAPLINYSQNKRGKIYNCETGRSPCSEISLPEPNHAVNMSLGLSMAKQQSDQSNQKQSKIVVCGPTIPRNCETITTYNGMCFQLRETLSPIGEGQPPKLEDCPISGTDIVFLIDGSGSVSDDDFRRMKEFMIKLIKQFQGRNTLFAVMQYSSVFEIHMDFNDYKTRGSSWESLINGISQQKRWTHTPTAIRKVVRELFVPSSGSRPKAVKVLVVITDGQTVGDNTPMSVVVREAEDKGIIRYAIGVGSAFQEPSAMQELETIASKPTNSHLFRVDNFQALDKLRDTLQKNIFAIEGTQTSGASFHMELAQEGFSSVLLPSGDLLMGTVGALDWRGGFQKISARGPTFHNSSKMEANSYLGYSMAVAKLRNKNIVILGAPRYQHKGAVVIFSDQAETMLESKQIGSYFGAELCAVDLDSDSYADLLLISAPMYTDAQRDSEGEVTVCAFRMRSKDMCTPQPLVGVAGMRGRFGTSLAALADLDGDGITDVAVGAPMENNGQGSVYIFSGTTSGVNPVFSQRIQGSNVESGLRYFGQSISGSLDQSGDRLTDIAVGSRGKVLLFRSRPVVSVAVTMSFSPPKIPTDTKDCTKDLSNTATVCFTMTSRTKGYQGDLDASVNYTLTLDATRNAARSRAYFTPQKQFLNKVVTIRGEKKKNCENHQFSIQACPEDALNPLINELRLSFVDSTHPGGQLAPVLDPLSRRITNHPLDFVVDCGADSKCTDDLRVDFNFSGVSEVQVGIALVLNVSVSVENRGENSYNSHVIFTYPAGLSFRRVTVVQDPLRRARVQCTAVDSVEATVLGISTCHINRPIFRSGSQVFFILSFGIDGNSNFDRTVTFTANASSGNELHTLRENYRTRQLGVKYSIFAVVRSSEESTSYINFTAGKNDLKKPVLQSFEVVNYIRDFNATITIKVPIKLGEKDIWTNKNSIQIMGCKAQKDENPAFTDFVEKLRKTPNVDCTVAVCRVLRCEVFLRKDETLFYNVSGEVTSGWIEQTQLSTVRLVSSSSMDFDKNQFIYFSSSPQSSIPVTEIKTRVDMASEPNFTKEIIGGAFGALLLLALIAGGLYKAGFFKSKYNQMVQEAGGEADGGEGENASAPPATE